MIKDVELPEGTVVLVRQPAGKSVELALELANLGASPVLVEAVGGEEALLQYNAAGTPQDEPAPQDDPAPQGDEAQPVLKLSR